MPSPPNKYPAQRCSFVGMLRAVSGHWLSVHDREIVMHHCPFPRCNYKTPKAQSLRWHWECAHEASKSHSKELKTLPPLVALVRNRHFQHPGNGQPLLPPAQLPVDSIPVQRKGELVVGVHRILMPRSATLEERRVVKIVSPQLTTFAAYETSSHVAEQVSWAHLQAPSPPATIAAQGANPPEEKLKVSRSSHHLPCHPPLTMLHLITHPSHSPLRALSSLPFPFIRTPPQSRIGRLLHQPWVGQPRVLLPLVWLLWALLPKVLHLLASQAPTTPPMKQDSPDLIPVSAPESPSIPTPPVPTRVLRPPDLLPIAPAQQETNPGIDARWCWRGSRPSALEVERLAALRDLTLVDDELRQALWELLMSSAGSCGVSWSDSVPLGSLRQVCSVTWSPSTHPAPGFCYPI